MITVLPKVNYIYYRNLLGSFPINEIVNNYFKRSNNEYHYFCIRRIRFICNIWQHDICSLWNIWQLFLLQCRIIGQSLRQKIPALWSQQRYINRKWISCRKWWMKCCQNNSFCSFYTYTNYMKYKKRYYIMNTWWKKFENSDVLQAWQ